MNILTILGMVVATSAVTLLCMRFGMEMTKTPIQAGKVHHHTTHERSATVNRGKRIVVTTPPDTTGELNLTDNSISRDRQGIRISLPGTTSTVSENQAPTDHSSLEHIQQENSRSLSDMGLVKKSNSVSVGPWISKSLNRQLIDRRDEPIDTNHPHDRNGKTAATGDNSENNREYVTDNTNDMYQINGRQISQKKTNRKQQLNTNMIKYATVSEENTSNGYPNAYDLTYNVGDNGYKEHENPAYEGGWTSAGRPEQTYPGSLWSGSSDSWEPPPYVTGEGYLDDQGPSDKPLRQPSSSKTQNDQNPLHLKLNNINWKTIGMLALLKLGLAKLQAIGFIKTLFLLGFSFKLYMIAVFFKFLLIMKLMKFFKILLLPLFLIQLLPTLIQLLMMPGRLLDLLRRLTNNNMTANQAGGSLSGQSGGSLSGQLGGLLPSQTGGLTPGQTGGLTPGQTGGLLPNRLGGIIPNRPGTATPGGTQRGGMIRATGKDIAIGESTTGSLNIVYNPNDLLFKLEDTHLTNVQSDESIQLSNPTSDIFQKLLDSEKCVERIACRIAVAEKTGNVPIWINWVLHRVYKLIPSDKLESYLKAYKDVNDEIRVKSSIPDNWVTWCSERYDYNCSSDNITYVSNGRQ